MRKTSQLTSTFDTSEKYDFSSIHSIVKSMEFLRNEAIKCENEDITLILDSAFKMCFVAYFMALRLNPGIRQN